MPLRIRWPLPAVEPSAAAAATLVACSVVLVLAGQLSLGLVTVDDFREVEVAREMYAGGDCVVPHLAGLPFVEKPPGFPFVVSLAYALSGGPSVVAARMVTVAFALASLVAVWLLGRRLAGPLTGSIAAFTLSISILFCRTAHTILLDNALTASCAWALYLTWIALERPAGWSRKRAYAGAAFALGLAFLVKGVVGPALFAAGFLTWAALRRRWGELAPWFHPIVLAAFLAPAAVWLVPFLCRGDLSLVREMFVANVAGRAFEAYLSHSRPFYYYVLMIWLKFAPGSIILPFAAVAAWRFRRAPEGAAGIFLLAMAAGATILLSISRAKDDIYLLPAYPALAVLVAWWCARQMSRVEVAGKAVTWTLAAGAFAGAMGAAVAGVWIGGPALWSILPIPAILLGGAGALLCMFRRDYGRMAWTSAVLFTLMGVLLCSSPIAPWYVERRSPEGSFRVMASITRDRDLLLFRPDDWMRGGMGFLRNRTAEEVPEPEAVVARLKANPRAAMLLGGTIGCSGGVLLRAAEAAGARFVEEFRVPFSSRTQLVLYKLVPIDEIAATR